jgi:integrase
LYLRSRTKPTEDEWYSDARVGINTISKVVGKLCDKAGLEGFYSNHSLRATAATRMYNADIPEQLICEKTGHRSDAVRSYKRTSADQMMEASDIVQGVKKRESKPVCTPSQEAGSKCLKISKGDVKVEIPF